MHWPVWMDHVKAKSSDMGGQSLAQHTWDVLARMADQRRLRPDLDTWLGDRIWSQMFWAAFLHDFGKSAAGFQGILRGESNRWSEARHRHEVLSLGFLDWVFPKGHPDRSAVLAMVVCHHKDATKIFEKYGGEIDLKRYKEPSESASIRQMLSELADNITPDIRDHLWRWLDECPASWAAELGFPQIEPPALIPVEQARQANLAGAIYRALREFHTSLELADAARSRQLFLLRGLILTSDHAASAGLDTFPEMPLKRETVKTLLNKLTPRDHQREADGVPLGSAILVAPTGSGKTEAALLWAASQLEQRPAARLFYTLPYQASMNAMYARLAEKVLNHTPAQVKAGQVETITIRHSRALLKLYQDMMSLDEAEPRTASRQAKWLRNKADLNAYPIQIFSPYQMLKAGYSLKGFETLVLDYTAALFIFDEIHAYEPKRLALIIELMRWLREGFGARFFVMTATLPSMLAAKLHEALAPTIIEATPAEFARSQRHVVDILPGRLIDAIQGHVTRELSQGRAVLVCLNRVADAQKVYVLLRDALGLTAEEDIVLLHGRFNGRDRQRKEEVLLASAGVGRMERRPFLCVATQVVEVSLNVDFDTIYSDPAPLEALLQRFGRVNRGRPDGGPKLPVHVFSHPNAQTEKPYLPYEQALVERSLDVLRDRCGGLRPIDESQVTAMLGQIYTGETLAAWEQVYQKSVSDFTRDILGKMRPFQSAESDMQRKFYKLFDGIEVLPIDLLDDYYEVRDNEGYLAASQYLVNISYGVYKEFDSYCRIHHARELEGEFADHIDVDYSAEYGLNLDAAREFQRQQGRPLGEDVE
jgi:CRISPR-associated endonuclease/helicase Cas3